MQRGILVLQVAKEFFCADFKRVKECVVFSAKSGGCRCVLFGFNGCLFDC